MNLWAADSHVHFHKCFDEGLFFDSCFNNLDKIKHSPLSGGILFFTESKFEDSYNYLKSKTIIKSNHYKKAEYILSLIDEENAIQVKTAETGKYLLIFPGFQIVTDENLEVLSLGTAKRINDGSSIEDTIAAVQSLGGIPVLPWGFGKWYGSRGKKIYEVINKKCFPLFLGDNGGRSRLLPSPAQFNYAKSKGFKILPGSDPLPFQNEVSKALSFGFTFMADLNESNLWSQIKTVFLDTKFSFEAFGKLTSPIAFLKTQLAMQIKKRSKA